MWNTMLKALGISGRKEYKQKGSKAKTKGRTGTGLLDQSISAARKRNEELKKYSK